MLMSVPLSRWNGCCCDEVVLDPDPVRSETIGGPMRSRERTLSPSSGVEEEAPSFLASLLSCDLREDTEMIDSAYISSTGEIEEPPLPFFFDCLRRDAPVPSPLELMPLSSL